MKSADVGQIFIVETILIALDVCASYIKSIDYSN